MRVTEAREVPALVAATRAMAGPFFAVAKVDAANLPLALPPREGAILQARMRAHLLGAEAQLD
jgi:hypothetical protein